MYSPTASGDSALVADVTLTCLTVTPWPSAAARPLLKIPEEPVEESEEETVEATPSPSETKQDDNAGAQTPPNPKRTAVSAL